MWKKLTLMQILTDHGVSQIPELYEDYKAGLSESASRNYMKYVVLPITTLTNIDLYQCATKANNWAMDVYRQCSNEYDAIYGQLTEKYGMLCLQFTNPF